MDTPLFIQRRPNVFDVGPTLYSIGPTDVVRLLGYALPVPL